LAGSVKEISDALIARLSSYVTGLNAKTVAIFAGSIKEFVGLGSNLPFVGVALEKIDYEELNAEGSLAVERLNFCLTAIAEDFRGRSFSVENNYSLIDSIRGALMGQTLGISGLSPVSILGVERDGEAEKEGLSVYLVRINTWQVRQIS
jgi:hypothetical protein